MYQYWLDSIRRQSLPCSSRMTDDDKHVGLFEHIPKVSITQRTNYPLQQETVIESRT